MQAMPADIKEFARRFEFLFFSCAPHQDHNVQSNQHTPTVMSPICDSGFG
jgi:hypothetical protein